MLAERYHWPKSLIDQQEPDYLDELATYINAQSDQAELKRKRAERDAKLEEMRRKHG